VKTRKVISVYFSGFLAGMVLVLYPAASNLLTNLELMQKQDVPFVQDTAWRDSVLTYSLTTVACTATRLANMAVSEDQRHRPSKVIDHQ
jgi:hypothetical protein